MKRTNLRNIAVGFRGAHWDGRKRGFWIGVFTMSVYYILWESIGYWAVLVPCIVGALVQSRRPS